jgi:competence protein ComEA
VFLLGVATTLLAIHASHGLRWGSRPTHLKNAYQIDLNRADRVELLQIPGVGESMAQRIEEYRRQHGAFQNLSDLRHVQGVGPATLERLRPWLGVQPAEMDLPLVSQAMDTPGLPTEIGRIGAFGQTAGARKSTSKKEARLTRPIDINRATDAELQHLPTVGQKRAQLIINERQKRPFTSVEDLRRVPGIGAKTLERLRPYVMVENSGVRMVTQVDP